MRTLQDYYTDEEIKTMLSEMFDKYTTEDEFGLSLKPAFDYIDSLKMTIKAKKEFKERLFIKAVGGAKYE